MGWGGEGGWVGVFVVVVVVVGVDICLRRCSD